MNETAQAIAEMLREEFPGDCIITEIPKEPYTIYIRTKYSYSINLFENHLTVAINIIGHCRINSIDYGDPQLINKIMNFITTNNNAKFSSILNSRT